MEKQEGKSGSVVGRAAALQAEIAIARLKKEREESGTKNQGIEEQLVQLEKLEFQTLRLLRAQFEGLKSQIQVQDALIAQQDELIKDRDAKIAQQDGLKIQNQELESVIKDRNALIVQKDRLMKERDAKIAQQDGLIKERDAKIAQLNGLKIQYQELESVMKDRNALIAQKDELIKERDEKIARQNELIKERDAKIAQQDGLKIQNQELESVIKDRNALITQKDELIMERDEKIAKKDGLIKDRDAEIVQLKKKLETQNQDVQIVHGFGTSEQEEQNIQINLGIFESGDEHVGESKIEEEKGKEYVSALEEQIAQPHQDQEDGQIVSGFATDEQEEQNVQPNLGIFEAGDVHADQPKAEIEEEQDEATKLIRQLNEKKIPLRATLKGFHALVTCVNDNGEVYLVPIQDKDLEGKDPFEIQPKELISLEKELTSTISNGAYKLVIGYGMGDLVAVNQFIKGWKRGIVLSEEKNPKHPNQELYRVQLLDAGKICTVNKIQLTRLPDEFAQIPPMAYRCGLKHLAGSKLESHIIGKFNNHVEGHTVVVHVCPPGPDQLNPKFGNGLDGTTGFAESEPYQVELWSGTKYSETGPRIIHMVSGIVCKHAGLQHPLGMGRTIKMKKNIFM